MSKTKTIIRVDKVKGYSVIDNTAGNDDRLSYGARGIMYKALTKPDDWRFYIQDFANHSPDGVTKVTSYFKELRQAGYIEYRKIRNELGHIIDSEYIFHEKPLHTNEFRKPKKVTSNLIKGFHRNSENPIHGKSNTRKTQELGNPMLLNTDVQSITDVQNDNVQSTEEETVTKNSEEKEVVSELRKIIEKNSSSPNIKFNSGNRIKLQDLLTKHSKQELLAAVDKLINSPNFHQWSIGGILQYVTDILYPKKQKQDCIVNKLFTNHKIGQFDGTANTILGN